MSFFTFVPTRFQWRQDTAANWAANNPIPLEGEPCLETDTGKWKIGDGSSTYNSLPYQGVWTLADLRRALDLIGTSATGDIIYKGASGWTRLAAGSNGQILTLASGLPSWGASAVITTDDFKFNSISSYTQYGSATWTISNTVDTITGSSAAQGILVRNGVLFADGIVSCGILQAEDAGLVLRAAYSNDYYVATIKDASAGATNNEIRIFKRVGGTFTQLGSTATIAFTRNTLHTFSFEASGTSLIAKFDGITKVSVTDSSITAAGKAGLRAGSGAANTFDSFTWP